VCSWHNTLSIVDLAKQQAVSRNSRVVICQLPRLTPTWDLKPPAHSSLAYQTGLIAREAGQTDHRINHTSLVHISAS
jgi:hypothetical protein